MTTTTYTTTIDRRAAVSTYNGRQRLFVSMLASDEVAENAGGREFAVGFEGDEPTDLARCVRFFSRIGDAARYFERLLAASDSAIADDDEGLWR